MKKGFSRIFAVVLSAVLLLAVAPPTLAAQATAKVTLDGTALSFAEKAQPILRAGRTYVPFRSIFEAMGATVAWDAATSTVSAQRDGVSVSFVVGQKSITVSEAGESRTATTDAASFVDNGSTFVPVRFAAQAFGAAVGWDSASQTVVIVDTNKLSKEFAGNFTVMNSYLAFTFPENSRTLTGRLSLDYTVHAKGGDILIPVSASMTGVADKSSVSGLATIVCDITAMTDALSKDEDAVPERVANLLMTLKNATVAFNISRTDGAMYLKGAALDTLGVPGGSWVRLPLDSGLSAVTGGALGETAYAGLWRHDFAQVVAGVGESVKPADAAVDHVGAAKAAMSALAARYADEKFVSSGSVALMLTDEAQTKEGAVDKAVLTLTMDGARVTAATREQTITRGEQILSHMLLTQEAGGLTLKSEIASTSYSAQTELTLTMQDTGEIPARRPEGTIVP